MDKSIGVKKPHTFHPYVCEVTGCGRLEREGMHYLSAGKKVCRKCYEELTAMHDDAEREYKRKSQPRLGWTLLFFAAFGVVDGLISTDIGWERLWLLMILQLIWTMMIFDATRGDR